MKKQLLRLLFIFILALSIFSMVYADLVPKPSLEILVKDSDREEYYLDLLINYTSNFNL